MAKVMNTVFGIGIAVILFIVVMLGTQVFYEEPTYESFNCTSYYDKPYEYRDIYSCNQTMTVAECQAWVKQGGGITLEQEKEQQECYKRLEEAQKVYGRNLFIINNIVGIMLVIASLFLFSMINIAAGTAFAGLILIIYGFMRGWQGTGDILKFIVSLVVTILFVTFAVIVNRRYNKNEKKSKKK